MKMFVAGATGLLGQALIRAGIQRQYQIIGISTSEPAFVDASYQHHIFLYPRDQSQIFEWMRSEKPDLVINAAAYASIPFCEQKPEDAAILNVDFPARLAQLCHEEGSYFIHLSSDQVFNGKSMIPYREDDATGPLNRYGIMKVASENQVLKENFKALVVRANIAGFRGRGEATFAEWLTESFAASRTITLFENYITSTMHVDLLAPILLDCHMAGLSGIYHITSADSLSKYEFGRQLAKACGLPFEQVIRGRMEPAQFSPERPPFLALNNSRVENALHRAMPAISVTIELIAQQFREKTQRVV